MTFLGFDPSAVTPESLRAVATAMGLTPVDSASPHISAYAAVCGDSWDVLDSIAIPAEADAGSAYVRLVEDAVSRLAAISRRSIRDVVGLLTVGNADVFKVRAANAEGGSIPLSAFTKLAGRVEHVMKALAAASFHEHALRERPVSGTERAGFLDHLRAGQTEVGSYVVTVLSPLPEDAVASPEGPVVETPLARSVNLGMSRQLVDLGAELDRVVRGEQGLEEAVEATRDRTGLLAASCEEIARLIHDVESPFEIGLVPSPLLPLGTNAPMLTALFSRPQQPLLLRAAELLTPPTVTTPHFVLKGVVTDTHQEVEPGQGDTSVKVRGLVISGKSRGELRTVSVHLTPDQRRVAVDAFDRRDVVLLEGELDDPDSRQWSSRGEVRFTLVAEESWEDFLPRPRRPPVPAPVGATPEQAETTEPRRRRREIGPLAAVRILADEGVLREPKTRAEIDDLMFERFGNRFGPSPLSAALKRAYEAGQLRRESRGRAHLYWRP